MTDSILATARRQPLTVRSLLTSSGRAAQPFRLRVQVTMAAVAGLHVVGLGLLLLGLLSGAAGAVTVTVAAFAYLRGLAHAFDFDHVSMIDNSTRKFVAEGRRPASVGLAFSAGHSTVVVLAGVLLIAGAGFLQTAVEETSPAARVLGLIGLSVSGLYLLLVAVANLAAFGTAWRLRGALRRDPGLVVPPEALTPRGPAARLMTAPLRRVREPRHIYVIGFLFSLGFDTSSQMTLLMVTAAATLSGASAWSLLALPFLFAAAMTLGDTCNGLMMLRMYEQAHLDPARKVGFNLLVTGVSITSALLVAVVAAASLATELGWDAGSLVAIASLDTTYAGYLLALLFAGVGLTAVLLWRRTRSTPTGRRSR